jgi:kynurenine formamidase
LLACGSASSPAAKQRFDWPHEQRGVTAAGHESMDTDTTDNMVSENYILQHGRYQIEVMANLDPVPATGALIVVTWPKVRDGRGFPARAFAILPWRTGGTAARRIS